MKTKLTTAFLFFVLITTVTTKAQQADSAVRANTTIPQRYQGLKPRKPILAFALSAVIPGGGQFYNHQPVKGGVIVGLELGCFAGAAASLTHGIFDNNSTANDAGLILATTFILTEIYAIIDAPVAAGHINNKYHLTANTSFGSLHILPMVVDQGNAYALTKPTFGLKLTLR